MTAYNGTNKNGIISVHLAGAFSWRAAHPLPWVPRGRMGNLKALGLNAATPQKKEASTARALRLQRALKHRRLKEADDAF